MKADRVKIRLFLLPFGLADAGLIVYGILALSTPEILVEPFLTHVYRFPAEALEAISYLAALFRLLGFLNLILGVLGLLALWRYFVDRQPWALRTAMFLPLLTYLGPIAFDNAVGRIGIFEILELVLFAAMVISGIAMLWAREMA